MMPDPMPQPRNNKYEPYREANEFRVWTENERRRRVVNAALICLFLVGCSALVYVFYLHLLRG